MLSALGDLSGGSGGSIHRSLAVRLVDGVGGHAGHRDRKGDRCKAQDGADGRQGDAVQPLEECEQEANAGEEQAEERGGEREEAEVRDPTDQEAEDPEYRGDDAEGEGGGVLCDGLGGFVSAHGLW